MKENCESFYNAHIDCLENNNRVRFITSCHTAGSNATTGIPLLSRVRAAIKQVHVRQARESYFYSQNYGLYNSRVGSYKDYPRQPSQPAANPREGEAHLHPHAEVDTTIIYFPIMHCICCHCCFRRPLIHCTDQTLSRSCPAGILLCIH